MVLFHPQAPHPAQYMMPKVLTLLDFGITNELSRRVSFVFKWEDATFSPTNDRLRELSREFRVINLNVEDISKLEVERAFRRSFGRSTMIEPTRYSGSAVRKSNLNAKHDGAVVQCPIQNVDPNMVYQRLIANRVDDEDVEDIRLALVGSTFPLAYVKRRPLVSRFSNTNRWVRLAEVDELLSAEEIKKLIALCGLMGLECGELDVLRDREDGQLYVVDVNSTAWGPPNGLPPSSHRVAVSRLAKAFHQLLEAENLA